MSAAPQVVSDLFRVLHLSASDSVGGAARAAVRLHHGLLDVGVHSHLLVQRKSSSDSTISTPATLPGKVIGLARPKLDVMLVRALSSKQPHSFSAAIVPGGIWPGGMDVVPDIIHLHWLGAAAMSVGRIGRIRGPVVWTLHDSWAFTGGCHVPFECKRYQQRCGLCPATGSHRELDLSRLVWGRKKSAWAKMNLTLVAPSRWIAECAGSSSLFHERTRIAVIPHGLDLDLYRPIDKATARRLLKLPEKGKLLLFGAVGPTSDENKGFKLLIKALDHLSGRVRNGLELAIFGGSSLDSTDVLAMPTHSLGFLHDDLSLVLAYSAADIMIVPSIQEAFGQTALEAQACGTPVVAFGATGLLDIVKHGMTGYLANPYDAADFAHGIEWILEDEVCRAELSRAARLMVEREFSIKMSCARYRDLYRELLALPPLDVL